jgi:hypothetical protein
MRSTIIAVVLVTVIVGAVVFAVTRTRGTAKITSKAGQQAFTVVNVETMQTASISLADWESWKNDKDTGYKISPKGQKFTSRVVSCWNCGEKIPAEPRKYGQEEDDARREYLCPKCKKHAYNIEAL